MNHAITVGDLVHWACFVAFLISLLITALLWLYNITSDMSDVPTQGSPEWLLLASLVMPFVPLVAWWLT